MPEEELGHALLCAMQVLARVLERAGEVAGGLGALVGHPHLDGVAAGEEPGQPLGVAPVVLAAPVGRGPVHLADVDGAVDAEGAQGAAQVEAGRAALVHRLGRLEPQRPLGDRRRVVAEPGPGHLAGHGVEGACGDGPCVDVETDGGDIIGHGGPLSVACGARPRLALRPLSPDPR